MRANSLRQQLLLSTATLVGALTGYGGRAYAACVNSGGSTYSCSGANATTQTINAKNAAVSTVAGFSVTTVIGDALDITGAGAISYTDTNASPLTAPNIALFIESNGDIASGNPGSVYVKTNGTLLGGTGGISARNYGSGALTVTANGDVTGTSSYSTGIYARNNAGTDLSVTTGAGTTVTGGFFGIFALSGGSGALSVTANGDVTGRYGIFARSSGSGATSVTANGDVTGTNIGISAQSSGTDLTVTTAAGTTVTGGTTAIVALNYGSGATSVTANGDVTGGYFGISARNRAPSTDLSVTTGAGTTVTGGYFGIFARSDGSGALSVTANGDVTGTNRYGILVRNQSGTDLTVTTGAGTTVTGGNIGIEARNYGSGALSVTTNGDVTGTADDGIFALSGGTPIAITVGSASHVTSNGTGAGDFAIDIVGGPASVTVAGTLNGGAGGAVSFDQVAALDDRLELQPGAVVNGTVFAGPGTDTFALGGSGEASFDVGTIGTQYQDFETFEKDGTSHWTLTGTNTNITNWAVNDGLLSVNGSMPDTAFTVNGGTLGGIGTIGSFTAMSGGIIAPGNAIGTLNASGNVVFQGGSIYQVEVDAAGNSDKVVAGGTATLNGGTVQVLAQNGNYAPSTKYTILTANGGVSGVFTGVTSNLAFLDPSLLYDANDVFLVLERMAAIIGPGGPVSFLSFCSVAETRNQCNVAHALDQFLTDNPLFLDILNQTAQGAREAFNALSGEVHASVSGVLADDSRYVREAVLGRLTQATYTNGNGQVASLGAGGPQVASLDSQAMTLGSDEAMSLGSAATPYATPAYGPGIAFWTNAFGAWGNFDGNNNAASADRNLGGFVSGMDANVGGSWRLGLATGYSQSDISVDARHSGADVNSFHLAGYAGGNLGPLALRSGGAWAWNDIDTSRAVIFPGFFEREKASYNADTGQVFGEVAYPTRMGSIAMEPFAGLAYVQVDTSSFKEHGGDLAALRGTSNDENVGYSTLGLRFGTVWHWNEMVLVPHASAAWQHAFDDVRPGAALTFASTGIGFDITGVPLAENSAVVEAGLDLNLSPTATLGVSYSGQLANNLTDNAVKGRFTWLF